MKGFSTRNVEGTLPPFQYAWRQYHDGYHAVSSGPSIVLECYPDRCLQWCRFHDQGQYGTVMMLWHGSDFCIIGLVWGECISDQWFSLFSSKYLINVLFGAICSDALRNFHVRAYLYFTLVSTSHWICHHFMTDNYNHQHDINNTQSHNAL